MTQYAEKFAPDHHPGQAESEGQEQTSQEIENEIKLPDSLDALDSVNLELEKLHGFISFLGWIMGDTVQDYARENIRSVISMLEDWIHGIIEDAGEIRLSGLCLLTECQVVKNRVISGYFGLNGGLAEIKRISEKVDYFFDNDLSRIVQIKKDLEDMAVEISRKLLGQKAA